MDELVTTPAVHIELERLRRAAAAWQQRAIAERLAVVARLRRLLARRALPIASTLDRPSVADTLGAEILPLLEAARFLERRAAGLLAPRRLRRGRPLWLAGIDQVVLRVPFGAVLILGPGNYPLMLPGIQALQALVAGNAVALKPGRAGTRAARALAALLSEAGLPDGLLIIEDESDRRGAELARAGFDRIVLTGSLASGRAVLASAAPHLTPCTLELSGADPVFLLPGADLDLLADCLAYGMRLNGGATCIAPRRVIGAAEALARLEPLLIARLGGVQAAPVSPGARDGLRALVEEALARGARLLGTAPSANAALMPPLVLAGVPHDVGLLAQDIFAPWLALVPADDLDRALTVEAAGRYALGASIFGPRRAAAALAARLPAGAVTINDLIVPTADPRLPFGGTGGSGYGTTRGAEGLLEMTRPRTISVRRTRGLRPHLRPPRPNDHLTLARLIRILHAGFSEGT